MKLNKLLTATVLALVLTALTLGAVSAQPPDWLTGDAEADFTAHGFDAVFYDPDTPEELLPKPPFLGVPKESGPFSGWDVLAVYFDYDGSTDTMYVGIDCNGVCGDADGDGDPGFYSGPQGAALDLPDLGLFEAVALALDTDKDGTRDVAVGVSATTDIGQFGTYDYDGTAPPPGFPFYFGASLPNDTPLYYQPSGATPDIEFSIGDFSYLPGFTPGQRCFEFGFHLFSGSFLDEGISEDEFSGQVTYNPGTGTPGYWKNHPDAWPVDEITIGGVTYTKIEAIPLMKEDKHDKTTTMFRSLVAAKLNVLIGNESSCIAETIIAADEWMATYGPVGSGVRGNSAAWKEGEPLYLELDAYNNGEPLPSTGEVCAPSRDDLE